MNPYKRFVSEFARVAREGADCPLGGIAPLPHPAPAADAPIALLFSPHPDDESITGGLALRLSRECGWKIINVAVTLGSKPERRAGRLEELQGACRFLGFELLTVAGGGVEDVITHCVSDTGANGRAGSPLPAAARTECAPYQPRPTHDGITARQSLALPQLPASPRGLEGVSVSTRPDNRQWWSSSVATIAGVLRRQQPRAIFFPHELDWNSTHIGTHWLVMDALTQAEGLGCYLVETEFWGQMESPNLLVEYSVPDVADLVAAISFHTGEVQRNPYHLRLPAWLHDNVRRGAELAGGQGQAAPDFVFGQLFRLRRWRSGRIEACLAGGRNLPVSERADTVFPP
jgi:LmbE family N-acetylglucosaminyl deacetylase